MKRCLETQTGGWPDIFPAANCFSFWSFKQCRFAQETVRSALLATPAMKAARQQLHKLCYNFDDAEWSAAALFSTFRIIGTPPKNID